MCAMLCNRTAMHPLGRCVPTKLTPAKRTDGVRIVSGGRGHPRGRDEEMAALGRGKQRMRAETNGLQDITRPRN